MCKYCFVWGNKCFLHSVSNLSCLENFVGCIKSIKQFKEKRFCTNSNFSILATNLSDVVKGHWTYCSFFWKDCSLQNKCFQNSVGFIIATVPSNRPTSESGICIQSQVSFLVVKHAVMALQGWPNFSLTLAAKGLVKSVVFMTHWCCLMKCDNCGRHHRKHRLKKYQAFQSMKRFS